MTKLAPFRAGVSIALLLVGAISAIRAQQPQAAAQESKPAPTEKNAAQIELLETRYRFESNGDSRKEVHARVRINNELGARQFARLNFDFNRAFQSVEIPFVRVTHVSGGTVDILSSAIADHPNPAVADYAAFHDLRVKSVRILGLQPDDLLEYRVVTTTTHHPLAPDFWLDHTFDRSGVVSEEIFALDLPGKPHTATSMDLALAPGTVYARVPYSHSSTSEEQGGVRSVYSWTFGPGKKLPPAGEGNATSAPDVSVTTLESWNSVVTRLAAILENASADDRGQAETALHSITPRPESPEIAMRAAYDFVSQKIATLDLPAEATTFRRRPVKEILDSRYATVQEKCFLLALLGERAGVRTEMVLAVTPGEEQRFVRPSVLGRPFVLAKPDQKTLALDPNLEVAPFAAIPPEFRGKSALNLAFHHGNGADAIWTELPATSPLEAFQKVNIEASLSADGGLTARARYVMRGDNELLLRVAFHKTEKDKWKDVAQMLALSDGFRGQIVHVTTSDPYSTTQPFTVEYEISQAKFVDWHKKTVRIPAILPLAGLPDAPTAAESDAKKPIELGTPLSIDLEAAIELPAGLTAQAPIGTSVNRDYATFASKYSVEGHTLHASRSLHFISKELPAARVIDFNAFLHAVQADQAQLFTVLEQATR